MGFSEVVYRVENPNESPYNFHATVTFDSVGFLSQAQNTWLADTTRTTLDGAKVDLTSFGFTNPHVETSGGSNTTQAAANTEAETKANAQLVSIVQGVDRTITVTTPAVTGLTVTDAQLDAETGASTGVVNDGTYTIATGFYMDAAGN